MLTTALALLLTLVPTLNCGPQVDDGWQEKGVFGTVYPQPADVVIDDLLVHGDELGGAEQILMTLAAGEEGFAAVWRDTRFGNLGLVLGELTADGERIDFEESVATQQTSRQFDPVVALGGGFTGAVAWFGASGKALQTMLRPFAGELGFASAPLPVGAGAARDRSAGGSARGASDGGRGSGASVPGLAIDGVGSGLVVWVEGDGLLAQRFRRGAQQRDGKFQPERVGEPFSPSTGAPAPTGSAVAAMRPEGGALIAWPSDRGVTLWSDAHSTGRIRTVKLDGIERAFPDRSSDGWWLVGSHKSRPVVAFVDAGLDLERELEFPRDVARIDAASIGERVAVALEWSKPGDRAAFELRYYAHDGEGPLETTAFPSEEGAAPRGVHLAANGKVLVAAWTDAREGDDDVFYRRFPLASDDEAPPPQASTRWNGDRASSDQTDASIASNGELCCLAWSDRREGVEAIWYRFLKPDGSLTDEARLSAPGVHTNFPAVAVTGGASPATLIAWKRGEVGNTRLVASVIPAGGKPTAAIELDPGQVCGGNWPAAVAARGDGFAVLFVRDRGEVCVVQVDAAGAVDGKPRTLYRARDGQARNPELTLLDDGRLLALWDVRPEQDPCFLVGRFLGEGLRPTGSELDFDPSPTGSGDLQPAAAPGPDGGFLLAWTGNESPTRDVFARAFDARGKPAGPPLAISVKATEQDYAEVERLADGSWVVVWEDDISREDHIHARRISADFDLGPRVTVNQREADFSENRTSPATAILGGNLVTIWTDRRRSKGLDVYLRAVGNGFDRVGPARVPSER
ncbi:hypothetical protein [Engelhardtia mirabilis]|uniref:Uncharacterized protein n=1 Tax=Engelhardtia mirabilis TaxID=2528011 RepID=A0A518BQV4_9BACT|nr:hypothetical protein Pla133_44770 [Planctomycetes bacterium Pla133]QDV03684.1 hypothetical protein Pla86_44750 [Planctomycetes bacterium Pla86]